MSSKKQNQFRKMFEVKRKQNKIIEQVQKRRLKEKKNKKDLENQKIIVKT